MGYDLFLYGKIAQKSYGLQVMGYGCKPTWEIRKGMSYERVWVIPGMG